MPLDYKKKFNDIYKNNVYFFANSIDLLQKQLKCGAKIVQLRDKHLDDHSFCNLAKKMLNMVDDHDALLIINDRVDIALDINAHGIHVGKEDESYKQVIKRAPDNMIVGISIDTVEEAIEAENSGATYIGAGAVFPTLSKKDAYFMGLENLSTIVDSVNIPIVAIGGISENNILEVKNAGAKCFAIISDINNAENIPDKIIKIMRIIA